MWEFWRETTVRRTRKVHRCESCEGLIAIGSSARSAAGKFEGDFCTCHYHLDCRCAEIAWNEALGYGYDEFCHLYLLFDEREEPDFMPVVEERWPDVAKRLRARVAADRSAAKIERRAPWSANAK